MPLLLTPAQPLPTSCQLPVAQVYAIVNLFSYDRLTRLASFELGYYVHEAASLPGSGVAQLALSLPTGFAFQLPPASIGSLGDPTEVLEAYAQHELQALLGADATIETVP
jgi:hypothetical protein